MNCSHPPAFLYGILGKPLGHSLSPALHNRAFQRLGHDGAYFAWEKAAEDLDAFFAAVRALPISGLSVTIPHKQAVIPYLDRLTERAKATGAVNTIFWQNDSLIGDNTDVTGFVAPLRSRAELPKNALVLGAGGASRAVLAGLRELGFVNTTVAVRNPAKAEPLAADFGCDAIGWEDREKAALGMLPLLLVNATPLGMKGEHISRSPLPGHFWAKLAATEQGRNCFAYDLVYSPAQTVFLSHARQAGIPAIDGFAFFMAQAMEQLALWTGCAVPADVASDARAFVEDMLNVPSQQPATVQQ